MTSITEQNQIEFKLGVTTLQTGQFNSNLILKIIKTLSAISNLGPKKTGYVIVGVADSDGDASQHKSHYNQEPYKMQKFNIVGIESEAKKYYRTVDNYLKKIKDTVKTAKVTPEKYKNEILTNIISRQYHGKEVLIFKAVESDEPMWFDGKMYERQMSHNNEVTTENHSNIYKRFFKKD